GHTAHVATLSSWGASHGVSRPSTPGRSCASVGTRLAVTVKGGAPKSQAKCSPDDRPRLGRSRPLRQEGNMAQRPFAARIKKRVLPLSKQTFVARPTGDPRGKLRADRL